MALFSQIRFEPAKGSGVLLKGSSVGTDSSSTTLINPNWDFAQMGIGGLNDEFSNIFRRAFASRLFPSNIIADLGIQHAKGESTDYRNGAGIKFGPSVRSHNKNM